MRIAIILVCMAPMLGGQTLLEQDFDAPGTGTPFTLSGGAAVVAQELNLTANDDGAAVFQDTPISTLSWVLEFDFQMDPGPDGAGVSFQESPLGPSYALLFFDVHQNPWDPNDNHVEITPSPGAPQIIYTPSFDMNNGEWFHVVMIYQNESLSVFLTPLGGPVEVAFYQEPVPAVSGVEWYLLVFGLNLAEHLVDNILLRLPPVFVRGDCNQDGNFDVSDPIAQLDGLFLGGPSECVSACDANDDGNFDLADPFYLLAFMFEGGSPPPLPFPDCGTDSTPDALTCDSFAGCP